MSGYHFFCISGYMDILDTDFFGYLDNWILGYHAYLDTWILGYMDIHFLWIDGYLDTSDIIFLLSGFWISYPSIRIFLDTFLNYVEKRQSNLSVKII